MAIGEDKVKVQIVVSQELANKVHELAERMELSDSRMGALLLEAAVDQNELIIKAVTGKFQKKLIRAFQGIARVRHERE